METTVEGAAKRPYPRQAPRRPGRWAAFGLLLAIGVAGVMLAAGPTWAQNSEAPPKPDANLAGPPSLKTIPVPRPDNLDQFVKSRPAAIALGKALFWDMQVGSDAVQACASCHFQAGADRRPRNAVNPDLLRVDPATLSADPDWTFQSVGPMGRLTPESFPFTRFRDPGDRTTHMTRDWNDRVSSPGVYKTTYAGQPGSGAVEQGVTAPDSVFNAAGLNTRRVEPRNAPTVINAVFNFASFSDGRANSFFNGSSLASQAVAPVLSADEMSFAGRTFPDVGKKLLNPKIVPLGKQEVHPRDSVLGPLAKSRIGSGGGKILRPGLKTTYRAMVRAAFHDQYWNSTQTVTIGSTQYSQMEANFSLFFGLAIQMYESTLVSDDSPYDRFQAGDNTAMSASAQEGLNIFLSFNEQDGVGGSCIACHGTSTFSNASVMHIVTTNFGASLPEGLIERMTMGDAGGAWYDSGYYNIGVRPFNEDLGRGGRDAFGNPLSFTERALLVYNGQTDQLSFDPFATDPPGVVLLPCGANDPFGRVCPGDQRVTTNGSFKTPTLRNVELTGPYFHNGGEATLMQVMDFYVRGGNFFERNIDYVDIDIEPLFGLNPNPILNPGGLTNPGSGAVAEANQRKVVDFLLALTDERVRWEKAPFDHPELYVPNGGTIVDGRWSDNMLRIPPVGARGLAAEGRGPLRTFLGLSPYRP